MGSKGSQITTQTSAPDPQAYAAYQQLLSRAQGVASTPYQAYTGEMVAPVNAQQTQGISNVNAFANAAQPNLGIASSMVQGASNPLTQTQIQNYLNPYTQDVVNATQNQFNNTNAQQQQQVTGNAIAQGALGGNRTGVAAAELANQQNLAQAPVIAGLYNSGYQGALNTAYQQYQQNPMAAGSLLGNLGVAQQTAGLAGANAQIGAGTLQQTTQQQLDAAQMAQFQQQQAYPYQQAQWLAGIDTGVGSQMGGTGSTTAPAPNQWSSILGGVGAGVGALGSTGAFGSSGWLASALPFAMVQRGGRVNGYNRGGVAGYATGGSPYGVANAPWETRLSPYSSNGVVPTSWIPSDPITHGSGAPRPPGAYNPPQQDLSKQMSAIGDMAKQLRSSASDNSLGYGSNVPGAVGPTSVGGAPLQDSSNNPYYGGGSLSGGDAYGGNAAQPLAGLSSGDYGQMHRGGVVGYADGGDPSFDDRFSASFPNMGTVAQNNPDGVINPGAGNEFRMLDKPSEDSVAPAYADWQKVVDTDLSRGQSATSAEGVAEKLPDLITGKKGASKTAQALSGDDDSDVSTSTPSASGIAPADVRAKNEPASGINLGADSKLWPSLMAAGFGMMASRSPFLGNAIGEGGIAGMSTYAAQTKAQQDADIAAQKLQLEREQIERPYTDMTAAQKAADVRAKENKIPFGWNENDDGTITPIKGGPQDPNYMQTVRDASGQPKWTPVGTVIEGDSMHPAIMNAVTGEVRDAVTGKPPSDAAKFEVKGQKAVISDDDAKGMADYVVKTGDFSRLQGLGYAGSNKVKVDHFIQQAQKDNNISNEDLASKRAEFEGRKAGQRTLGVQEAKMGSAAIEAEGAIAQARGVIERLPRTSFLPLNKLAEGYSNQTLNPDQTELFGRTQAIVNTYAAVMSRGANITSDSARAHGEALLNTAGDPETYNRMLDTMLQEINLAKTSPGKMREYYAKLYGAKSIAPDDTGQPPAATTAPVHPPNAVGTRKDTSGRNWYVDKDGKPLGPAQ